MLDFYGEMLTEKQRNCLAYYYEEDLSLSEIAENEGISRQAFEIQSNVQKLSFLIWKKRLGLAKRFTEMKKGVDEIVECADKINEYNLNHTLSMEVNDNVARIKTLASFLKEG